MSDNTDTTAAELAALAADTYRASTDADDTAVPPVEPEAPTEPPVPDADAPPPPAAPARTLTGVTMTSVTQRWVLSGPPGSGLDLLVSSFILMGFAVEAIVPGTSYRLNTVAAWLPEFAEGIAESGYKLEQERATPGVHEFRLMSDESRQWRRATYFQGAEGEAHDRVARAVDLGLTVRAAGVQRYRVTGPGQTQVRWLAQAWGKTAAEVLAQWGTDAAALAAEDCHVPSVNVALPDRRITTEFIDRDADGNLEKVVQTERTLN